MADTLDLFNVGDDDAVDTTIDTGSPAIVFIVDCSTSMYHPDNYVHTALIAIRKSVRRLIVGYSSAFVSVIFMATNKFNNGINMKNLYILFPMLNVGADVLKIIDETIEKASTDSFETEYGSGDFALFDAIWAASTSFQEVKRKLRKSIFLITNYSNPFSRQENIRLFSIMSDFERLRIQFNLVPIGDAFNGEHYQEFLKVAGSPDPGSPVSTADDLIERLKPPANAARPLTKLNFHITNDVSIAISITYLVTRRKPPNSKPLYAPTSGPIDVKNTVKFLDDYDDENDDDRNANEQPLRRYGSIQTSLQPSQIMRCYLVGGKTIAFTNDEMSKINMYIEPELRLIGFKDYSCLSYQLHLQPCAFVYPVEKIATGSTSLFAALMKRCEAKQVVAFCSFCPRKTSTSRYVVLIPSREPQGFLMIYIPFGDEVRELDLEASTAGCTTGQVDIMKRLVKKMSFPYSPDNFPNPRLEAHWNTIEALALDKDPELLIDASLPDNPTLRERLGDILTQVREEVCNWPSSCNSEGNTSKSSTSNDVMDAISAVQDSFNNDSMDRLTVQQLKSYLKSVGLSAGLSKMKKADFINAASTYLRNQGD